MTPTEIRLRLRAAGFSSLPLNGKVPEIDGWQRLGDASEHEIRRWATTRPAHTNTGILTRLTPGFDADILDEECAIAIERMLRDIFEEDSRFLVRFGRLPKRLIPFQTDEPFEKILVKLIAPDGATGQRIEVLCDGQQFVAYGIHPDTGKPYSWFGGEPGEVRREDLPPLIAAKAREIVNAAVEIAEQHGYRREQTKKAKLKANPNGAGSPADWIVDYLDHDQLAGYAMRLLKSGMNDGAAVNFLRAQVEALTNVDANRKARRLREIAGMVSSAREKIEAAQTPMPSPSAARPLAEVHTVFRNWLGQDYDLDVLNAVLATAAAEQLEGDPLWLLVVSGPGNAKTETVIALAGAGAHVTSTISSEGALLSATPAKQRSKQATGGLLRKIGDKGILVIKDLTSILSADRNVRGPVLAALREVYDGRWERNVGTDGGRTLPWTGRIVVVGAVTTKWDACHEVISAMGDRFVLIRADSTVARIEAATQAIRNIGREKGMREELAQAAGGLIGGALRCVRDLTDNENSKLVKASNIVTAARTSVERDYRSEVIDAHAPEMPTRFAKQIAQIVRGAMAIGIPDATAMRLAIRCARDSIPPLRREILLDVACNSRSRPREVHRRIGRTRNTVRRELEALFLLRLLKCSEEDEDHGGEKRAVQYYSLDDRFDLETLREMTGVQNAPAPTLPFGPTAGPGPAPQATKAKPASPPPPPRWTGANLAPHERIDGARGAGAKFDLWPDGAGFNPDLTFVADAATRDMLIDMIRDNYDAILAELRREAGHAAH
jgi:hypothetical protein